MDFNNEVLCTITKVMVINESAPINNDKIMSIVNKMEFDGIEQPLFNDKINCISD